MGKGQWTKEETCAESSENTVKTPVMKTPDEFVNAANLLMLLVCSINLPISRISVEPPEVANAPPLPERLQMHKFYRKINTEKVPYIELFSLFDNKIPNFTQYCKNDKDPLVCGHKVQNLDEHICAPFHKVYGDKEIEECLCCPLCKNWFHESCFSENCFLLLVLFCL